MSIEFCLKNTLGEEQEVLDRAEKVLEAQFGSADRKLFQEYFFLKNSYQKLLKQNLYVYKISDTYQKKLIEIKDTLKSEISRRNKTEKALNDKIEELLKTQKELKATNLKLEKISSRDHLTGLCNRQEFERVVQREWKDAIREEQPISMMMVDIDNFKAFNDHYGHLAGDHCLQKISQTLNRSLKRPRDFVARFGGEEFIILLPQTDETGARHAAERVRETVEKQKIPNWYSTVSQFVTVSVGVATTEEAEFFVWEELLDKADQALYEAKGSGKNRYCFQKLSI